MSIQNWNRGPIYSLGELTVTVEEVQCDGCGETFENRLCDIPGWGEIMVRETKHGNLCQECYWTEEYNFFHFEAPGMPHLWVEELLYHQVEPLDFGYIYS